MELVYQVKDRPPFGKTLVFALQQLLAILAATIAVPAVINSNVPGANMSQSAALFGAGMGTIVYLLFTKFRSPVFLGSSFAFIGSMLAAFAGGVSMSVGYLGLIIGAAFAGLVYVIIALIVKKAGVNWINKLMPAVVIGPTVAIIGLSLAGNAIGDLTTGGLKNIAGASVCNEYVALICGLVTLFTVIACSVYGKKMMKLIPFIIGILAGYAVAAIFTAIGYIAEADALKVIDFTKFKNMQWYPDFAFLKAFKGEFVYGAGGSFGTYLATIAVAYAPVAFVVFAEHIADHKNLSSIINHDLLVEPGLDKTLLGDGVGSVVGAFFGGCPNTTYGESVGCVAITGNASVATIFLTAIIAIVASFVAPFVTFLATIPNCVMGGVCITLYGFIAVSGLKMIQKADLGDNKNLFVVSVILIAGIGGMTLNFGKVTITSVACALILGIITNLLCSVGKKNTTQASAANADASVAAESMEATENAETK
ncbi:MAG: solute carrier family 23 protein [Candidatus Borkfalkiaceae bacterium]|nr:uracil-xanthine permease [Clostridiales bacterium]MDD6995428.1 solute carrier family 23 protein [Clostridia bacterium]MDY6224120.1 solute carrier family 23 protein [Christensenellaceae bacterium]